MLHHVSVGVADVARASTFYDKVLAALGYKRVMEVLPYGVAYGTGQPEFWIGAPANQAPASSGNGVHIAFKAATKEAIEAFHRAALEAGGADEGGPGPRPDYGPDYYCAFVRDPDGNKLEAVLAPEPPPRAAERAPAARPTAGRTKRGKTKTAKRKPAKKAKKVKAAPRKKPKKRAKTTARKIGRRSK